MTSLSWISLREENTNKEITFPYPWQNFSFHFVKIFLSRSQCSAYWAADSIIKYKLLSNLSNVRSRGDQWLFIKMNKMKATTMFYQFMHDSQTFYCFLISTKPHLYLVDRKTIHLQTQHKLTAHIKLSFS